MSTQQIMKWTSAQRSLGIVDDEVVIPNNFLRRLQRSYIKEYVYSFFKISTQEALDAKSANKNINLIFIDNK